MSNPLQPYDWRVPPTQENPIVAYQSSMEFPINETRSIVVANHLGNVRYDVWVVLERTKEELLGTGNLFVMFVNRAYTQTAALDMARHYAWTIYRKDISETQIPF